MGASVHTNFIDLFKDDWFLLSDLGDFVCGALLGSGSERMVFEFSLDEKFVIKIDKGGHFSNVSEWEVYHNVKDGHPEYLKYLAPCRTISSCGRILLQEKTLPITKDELPKQIPDFFADTKIQNWGKIGDNIVCHDYANHRFYTKKIKLIKADWWSDRYEKTEEKEKEIL